MLSVKHIFIGSIIGSFSRFQFRPCKSIFIYKIKSSISNQIKVFKKYSDFIYSKKYLF